MSHQPSDPRNAKFAWRDVPASGPPKRSALERAADFLEIYGPYDEATAREQASRCIQCPNPSCVQGCPLCNPIPQWMQLTAEGKFLEAAAVIGSTANLPEICSRLCPADHLCEHQCILDSISDPVPIRSLEQFVIDYAFAHQAVEAATAPPNGFKVAVAGSGPAALACADELSSRGYAVTVVDSAMVPGGLLVNGIPAFALDGSIVERRIVLLRERGVKFQLGAALWTETTLQTLMAQFDAVLLAMDAREARPLSIPGSHLKGLVPAITFLLQKATGIDLSAPNIDVEHKRVVIIGGGDSAMDSARSAIRYGAASVLCVYRRTEAQMPCKRPAFKEAVEEGVEFLFQAVPVEVLGDGQCVTGLRFVRTTPEAQAQPGTEFSIEADWIIAALGFDPVCCPDTEEFSRLRKNDRGGVQIDVLHMTSLTGVFAAGDLVRGPMPLLETVRDARKAVDGLDQWLKDKASA